MSFSSRLVLVLTIGSLLFAGLARAGGNKSIQGILIGENGKPVRDGEIRAKRMDAKAKVATVRTDATGHYAFEELPAGSYLVTAYVWGFPRSSAKVRTPTKGWAKVDFDLRLNEADDSAVDQMQRDIQNSSGTLGH